MYGYLYIVFKPHKLAERQAIHMILHQTSAQIGTPFLQIENGLTGVYNVQTR